MLKTLVLQRRAILSKRTCENQGIKGFCPAVRGHLTCTNKRAQADEQEIARKEGFSSAACHAPTLHVLNVGPSEFPICDFREHEKVAELFGSVLSHLLIRRFLILVWVIAQEASKTLKMAFRLCTFVGAHEAPSKAGLRKHKQRKSLEFSMFPYSWSAVEGCRCLSCRTIVEESLEDLICLSSEMR